MFIGTVVENIRFGRLNATDEEVVQAMQAVGSHKFIWLKNRTSFVITRRISTFVNADRIFVIQNGSLVEQGTHNEWLAQNGDFQVIDSLYPACYNVANLTIEKRS